MKNLRLLVSAALSLILTAACGTDGADQSATRPPGEGGYCRDGAPAAHYALSAPCAVGVAQPTRLLLTTTDFSTGAVSVADLADRRVDADVALGSTDAIPFVHGGLVYLVNRFGNDYIDVLDPADGYRSLGQHAVTVEGVNSTNPQGVAFRADGLGFVTLHAAPEIQLFDFSQPSGQGLVGRIDMSAYADEDGNPELSLAFSCGDTVFVTAQRLDATYAAVDDELLIAVDGATCQPHDDPLVLQGTFARQVRADPRDASGHTVLLLTTGLEQVDLAGRAVRWAIDEARFAEQGMFSFHLQAFALHGDHTVYIAAYASDFSEVAIWRVALAGAQPLEKVISGLNAVEKTLEIVGDELWVGDTTIGGAGLRVYDLRPALPTAVAGPLSTGLPPYSMVVF